MTLNCELRDSGRDSKERRKGKNRIADARKGSGLKKPYLATDKAYNEEGDGWETFRERTEWMSKMEEICSSNKSS